MSKLFHDFSGVFGTLFNPQSNGKAEAIVKSMKNLNQAAWTGSLLDEGKLAHALLQYRNTPETVCHRHRNSLEIRFKTHSPLTIEHSHRSGNGAQKRLISRPNLTRSSITTGMLSLSQKFALAPTLRFITMFPSSGTSMAWPTPSLFC